MYIVYVFRINVTTDTEYRPTVQENECSLLSVGHETCDELNRKLQKGQNSFVLNFMNYYNIHLAVCLLLLLSVGLPVANAPDVLHPYGLLHYP